jgi:hypothetical protein
MIRSIIFHLLHWKNKLTMRNVKFNGYGVIFAFPGSEMKLGGVA